MCGSCSCPARTFALMPSLMGVEVNEHAQAVLDIMPRFRRNTWWSSKRYLHFLIRKFAESNASVTRDKIYALLGMSEDAYEPPRFYPCYEKSDTQVFQDTACFLLFGEILNNSSHPLPDFTLSELSLPIIQLAKKTLIWSLSQSKGLQDSTRTTANHLVRRINEGQLKTEDLLLSLTEEHGKIEELRNLFSHGNVDLTVDFTDEQNILTITSEKETTMQVDLAFPRGETDSRKKALELDPLPFEENENMTETIGRLIEAGSSKEEILRAYTWAGDTDAVQGQLEAGADIDGADIDGRTALHLAARRGYSEIAKLLMSQKADVNKKDKKGRTALMYAAGRANDQVS